MTLQRRECWEILPDVYIVERPRWGVVDVPTYRAVVGLIVGGGGVERRDPKQTTTVSLTAANGNHQIMHRNRSELPGICLNSDLWPALPPPRKTVHNGCNGCSQTHSTRCFLRLLHLGSPSGPRPAKCRQPASSQQPSRLHFIEHDLSSLSSLSSLCPPSSPPFCLLSSIPPTHHPTPQFYLPLFSIFISIIHHPNNSLGLLFLSSHTPPKCEKT